MMKKQQKVELEQRKQLQSDGWDVNLEQSIKSNDGFVNERNICPRWATG